jgi:hypothetical protein
VLDSPVLRSQHSSTMPARANRDFVALDPRKTVSKARRRPQSMIRRLLQPLWRGPLHMFVGLTIGTAAGAIIINAVGLQTARHPAPIFHQAAAPAAIMAAPSILPPLPPIRPVADLHATTQAPHLKPRDMIAEALRNPNIGTQTAALRAPEASAQTVPQAQRIVSSAQRALIKLGYGPLKADGVMGAGTRQAIERFEKDYQLPVTGELNFKTTREMALRAGIAVE